MTSRTIEINGKTFRLKIGLTGIIYLQSLSQQNEESMFIASIITLQDITVDEARKLYHQYLSQSIQYQPLFEQDISFLNVDVQDLYSRAVGELGISPDIALQMTPDEIELAYIGYLRRQEMNANLTKLAILQALEGNNEPIKLLDKLEYTFGSLQERQQTFKELEIE